MRSLTILILSALSVFGWSFLQAQEANEVLKNEFEKKAQIEQSSYFYQLDYIAIANSKVGGTL